MTGTIEQPNHEIEQGDWDAVTADTGNLSADSFPEGNVREPLPEEPTATIEADDGKPADQGEQPQPAAAAPAPDEPADPFAGLPEAVRNALATIPTLQQELRSTVGRVGALQRELAQTQQQRAAAPAPEAEAPRLPTKLDALRAELPEVAEAIDELANSNRGPSTEELRAELAAELQEQLLETQRPTWAQELTSNEFQAWLTTQAPDYQAQVRSATRAADVLGALGGFDRFKAQATQRTQQLQRSQSRLSAAVSPSSGARRSPAKSEDDMTPDELWNHISAR